MHSAQSQSSSSSGRSDASAGGRRKPGGAPHFPLPDGYFGHAALSRTQELEFEALVDQRLEAALADERAIQSRLAQHLPRLDPSEWKFVSTHQQLQIYRSRRRRANNHRFSHRSNNNNDNNNSSSSTGEAMHVSQRFPSISSSNSGGSDPHTHQARVWAGESPAVSQPSVVGIGRVEGSMEDVIYGLFDTSRAEMLTSVSFLDNTTWDGSLLHCITAGVPEDPFRLLGVKWLLSRFASSVFIAPRDWCYVVASGIRHDAQGQRYGYVVTHSVTLSSCPPFNYKETGVIRGKMFFHFLLRESTPGFMQVFSRGIFDPAGDLIRAFVNVASAKMISGLFRTIDCAEAKKITILARRHARERLVMPALEDFCATCIKRGSNNVFAAVRLRLCGVCGVTVCTKCALKKRLFAHPAVTIRCCSACVLAAKRMTGIRPAEPEYSLLSSDSAASSAHKLPPPTGGNRAGHALQMLDEESSSHSSGPSGSSSGTPSIAAPEFDSLGRMLLSRKADKEESALSYPSERKTMGVDSSMDEGALGQMMYPDNLSDLDSDEYHFSSGSEGSAAERDPEQELLRLLKRQTLSDSMGLRRAPSGQQSGGEDSDSAPPSPLASPAVMAPPEPMHQDTLYQRMLEIQNTAEHVYELTQANERIIQNLQ